MKPRIAILIPMHGLGGVEHVMKQLCAALIGEGIDCELLTLDAFRTSNTAFRVSGTAWLVARYLKRHGFTALISAKEEANAITALIKTAMMPSLNTVVTRHVPLTNVGTDSRWYVPYLYQHMYRQIDHIVAVSDGIADMLRTVVGPQRADRVHSLPNAVIGPDFFTRAEHSVDHPWFKSKRPVVVTVGRLAKQKNLALLADALGCMAADTRPHWLIIGEGPERAALDKRIQLRAIQSTTQFLGAIDNPLPWMRAANVVALPSLYEGLPTVLIEALTVGTPCVATHCPTGPQQIAKSGGALHLVDNPSPIGFANGIEDALDTKTQAASFDTTPFTFKTAAQGMLSILNSRTIG